MKKYYLIAMMSLAMMTSCSNDENPIKDYGVYSSSVKVDGVSFLPSLNNTNSLVTSMSSVNNINYQIFHLEKNTSVYSELEILHFSVSYNDTQMSVDGSYTIDPENFENQPKLFGTYIIGGVNYSFFSGIVKITKLDVNEYKFVFKNVMVKNTTDPLNTKTINGTFISSFLNP